MAAGPADAFSATPRGFGCYDRELISAAADNLWSSSVVATASTGSSWVEDVHSDPLEKRIEELKRKFHRGRQLQIKHLPREVTEEEIRELLAEWDVQSVSLQSGSARVALCSPELLEEWDRNAVFTLRGQRVSILPSPTEMLLCIGRIPLSYNEQQFSALVATYGDVKRSFVMISERTGDTKGYGFVEYVTKEAALQAKNALDGKQILDTIAVCDWLDSSHVTLRSLHSKCLYIDRLPPNYRDMGEFRRIFSAIVNPPYCQIALRNGCPQDWGLVEFIGEDDAERTQQNLDGYLLHGQRIRVAYYIPGVRAINLYLKLLNDGGSTKGKSALLPDPPAPAVFQQLQSLAKQNPVFAQNLQSIILQQIQDVQKGQPGSNNGGGNALKNAQQTALTLLLASQLQNGNGGPPGVGGNGSSNGGGGPQSGGPNGTLSPNTVQQNQQLLSALQAMRINTKDDQWSAYNKPSRNSQFHSNGLHKNPLLPSPSGVNSPGLDIPMDTGINAPKSPPGDPLQAVWYSLFGHSSPPESVSNTPGTTSPLFMKNPMNNSNGGSPVNRPDNGMYGMPPHGLPNFKNAPPGFPNGHHPHHHPHHQQQAQQQQHHHQQQQQNRMGSGDIQDAINSLLSNPHNLTHLFGNGGGLNNGGGNLSPPPQFPNHHHHQQQQSHNPLQSPHHRPNHMQLSLDVNNGGVSSAILDLLMQSMKNDQQQHHSQGQQNDAFGSSMKHNGWSTGMSSPPSPIGTARPFGNGPGGSQSSLPQRSGSNGSSEMSSSSPRSPTYSPFSRNNKGLMDSGNGNISPTPWSNAVLGSPPHQGFGNNAFQNRIWAPSISPGGSNHLMNPMGQKRKVNHESMSETEFIGGGGGGGGGGNGGSHQPPGLTSHYADSYFKKKKKN